MPTSAPPEEQASDEPADASSRRARIARVEIAPRLDSERVAQTARRGVHSVRRAGRDPLTWIGLVLFIAAFVGSAVLWGIPWSRDRIFLWMLAGLAAVSLRNLKGFVLGFALDWIPVFSALFVYDLVRGYADGLISQAHVLPQMRFDEIVFGGTVPTVWLQEHLYDPGDPHIWDFLAWGVYTSHFFVALTVGAVLWKVAYHRFHRYMGMFVALTLMGFATYALYPAVPPWMASDMGHLEPTTRIIREMWAHVGIDSAATIWAGGSEYANDVAAVPSLHAAYPVLLLMFFWPRRMWLRIGLFAYAAAMAFTLVYTSEHYVSDEVLGWIYAGIVYVVGTRIADRRAARKRAAAEVLTQPAV